MIRFNKPYLTGNENKFLDDAIKKGKILEMVFLQKNVSNFLRYPLNPKKPC